MQSPLKLTIHGVDHSEALETRIRAKVEKLEEFFEHITSCHVVVEMPHKHHHQGRQFNVRIDIGVPGNEIVVTRDHAEDVYVALRDAIDAAKRQLKDYASKLRGDIKTHEPKRTRGSEGSSEELGAEYESTSADSILHSKVVGRVQKLQHTQNNERGNTMSNITRKQIDTLQGVMEAELAQLVDETQDEMDIELKENYIDIDGNVADTGDDAVADTIIDIDNAIIGLHLQKASDLNAALDRIQTGVYGICIDCGDDIGFERLSAYPTAKRCIKCQSLHEKTFASEPTSSF